MNNNGKNLGSYMEVWKTAWFCIALVCSIVALTMYCKLPLVTLDVVEWGEEVLKFPANEELCYIAEIGAFTQILLYIPVFALAASIIGLVFIKKKFVTFAAIAGMVSLSVGILSLTGNQYIENTSFPEIFKYIGLGTYLTLIAFVVILVCVNKIEWYAGSDTTGSGYYSKCDANEQIQIKGASAETERVCPTCGKKYDSNKYSLFCPHCNSAL